MSSNDIAIRVENLSKCYPLYDAPRDRLKQFILPRLQRFVGKPPKNHFREFWALKDISFQVRKGETFGIIGRNGAGKSTLLQIICGTLTPTSGSVEVNGRAAALLELGSGFNYDFTGRENIYMNGTILGLSREDIAGRFDDIERFADIGTFVDLPLKTYSSGMVVRLAFATAVSVNSDILIVDEAIAVGDARFQAKCFRRIQELRDKGVTILLVTHSTDQVVRHCDRAILLDAGAVVEIGEPRTVTNRYLDLLFSKPRPDKQGQPVTMIESVLELGNEQQADEGIPAPFVRFVESADKDEVYCSRPCYNPNEYRWGDGRARIIDYFLWSSNVDYPTEIDGEADLVVIARVLFLTDITKPVFGFFIKTIDGLLINGTNSREHAPPGMPRFIPQRSGNIVSVLFSVRPRLISGNYLISLGIAEDVDTELVPLDRRYDSIIVQVTNRRPSFGLVDLGSTFSYSR